MSGFEAPYWNALQTLAWFYLGDRALVDLCGGEISSASMYWAEQKVLGEDGGLHSVLVETPGNPPNLLTLAVYAAALGRACTGSPGTEDNEREILHKLADGSLSVTGIQKGSRVRQEIAALEWCDLSIDYDKQAAVDRVSRNEKYERLMFRREAVLRLRPDVLTTSEGTAEARAQTSPERRCHEWLLGLMKGNSKKTKLRREYQAEAVGEFGVGSRAFGRAWGNSIRETGNSNWGNPGRISKRRIDTQV